MMKKNLDLENIEQLLQQSVKDPATALACLDPKWTLREKYLERTFPMPNFQEGLLFVTREAFLAERAGHPDVTLHYQDVTLRFTTHDRDAFTWADVALAHAVNGLDTPSSHE